MKKIQFIVGIIVMIYWTGCQDIDVQKSKIEIINGENLDSERLSLLDDTVDIISAFSDGRVNKDLRLIIKTRLDPPMIDGQSLMATCVSELATGFTVSYNFKGEPYRGSLDFVNRNLKLQSQVIFNEMDAHSIFVSDSDKRKIYTAGASESAQGASLSTISISGNEFFNEDFQEVSLGSYAATSVIQYGNLLLVTTGDDETGGGGLYLLDMSLNVLQYVSIHDARWVSTYGESVYVMQGTPGMIQRYVMDPATSDLTWVQSIPLQGANVPESKSTIWIEGDRMFVAGGTAGVHMIDLTTNEWINSLSFEAEDAIVNAVTANEEYLFVSCGEAGVYVVAYDSSGAMETLGYLDLALSTSVNHIYQKSNKLYVAAGLEGLLYMEIK
jgi:hypothetical protein